MDPVKNRLIELFEATVENEELSYEGEIDTLDHYKVILRSIEHRNTNRLMGCDVSLSNYIYNENKSVLIIFSIPINSDTGSKLIADRVMEIVENIEQCFIKVDYLDSVENKNDKFVYVTIVKEIEDARKMFEYHKANSK